MTQEEFAFCCNACKNLNSPIGMACDFCENASNFESKDNMPRILRKAKAERNNAMNKAINKICNIPNEYKLYIDDFTSRTIKNVIFNDPATIVFWTDGTKTVVKAKNEEFDPEKGLAMAIAKKFLGNKGSYYNEFKKWIKQRDVYNPYYENNVGKEVNS